MSMYLLTVKKRKHNEKRISILAEKINSSKDNLKISVQTEIFSCFDDTNIEKRKNWQLTRKIEIKNRTN